MRMSDARWRRHTTKLIYPNHRLPSLAHRRRNPRSLEPIVSGTSTGPQSLAIRSTWLTVPLLPGGVAPGLPPSWQIRNLKKRWVLLDHATKANNGRSSNDEVERRGAATMTNEADLSQSSTPSLAHRRRGPRSLEPIVRRQVAAPAAPATNACP